MRQHLQTLPVLAGIVLLLLAPGGLARRVRVRPVTEDVEDQEVRDQQVQYYAAQAPNDDTQTAGVVLVSTQDAYGGLQYARPRGQTAIAEQQYRPVGRALSTPRPAARAKEPPKQPPVQTIRNYSKVNDDGSFTFGYEAADGSFKEETRGTDCVVRGKYGYVDPDGNKREFTYVSGNPCDPNSVSQEEEEHPKGLADDSGEENIPKGPLRPLRPRPTAAPISRPTTTVFQQSYNQPEEDELDDVPQHVYQPAPPVRARVIPQPTRRPQVYQTYAQEPQEVVTQRPAVRITPRPPTSATTVKSQLPATTYRPQLLPVSVTPRPGIVYTKQVSSVARPTQSSFYSTPTTAAPVDFDDELRKFQLENNVVSTPRPTARPAVTAQPQYQTARPVSRPQAAAQQSPAKALSADPIYQTELVYDPSSGQYNTVLYQTLPQTTGEVSLKHRLQPFVHGQQPQSLFTPQIYQQIQQNQQLYSQHQQQQRVVEQRYQQPATKNTGPQRFQLYQQQTPQQRPAQPFYYITPTEGQRDGLAQGQIDAFLRGHNIAF
ncbi:uncharacterized protein [Periplaneta americana]|uniref:uncharacterized protein n=1 Tax=Periplaneta americana TaxID=6978 RepID=UPI0037E92D69